MSYRQGVGFSEVEGFKIPCGATHWGITPIERKISTDGVTFTSQDQKTVIGTRHVFIIRKTCRAYRLLANFSSITFLDDAINVAIEASTGPSQSVHFCNRSRPCTLVGIKVLRTVVELDSDRPVTYLECSNIRVSS